MKVTFSIIIGLGLMFSCISCQQNESKDNKNRTPNIILIMVDDVSAIEFNFYNGPGINTPSIDKMAKEGIIFKTAYSQPVCGPSRAELLTGKYASSTGYYSNNIVPKNPIHDTHYTMGKVMKDLGYRNGWFGKQHIDRHLNPNDFGFDYYVVAKYWEGYDGPSQGHGSEINRMGMYGAEWYWHPALIANGKGIPVTSADFGPEMELDSLLYFIEQDSEKPFFAYWPTNLPHHEYDPENETWVRPDVPEYDEFGNKTGNRIKGSMQSNLEFMDQSIEMILAKLKETGKLDNTILFFTGDNGTAGYGKGKLESEIAIHVPFVVSSPKIVKPGGISDVLTDFTDLVPTFMELAGGNPSEFKEFQGKSLAPYLLGDSFESRKWISAQLDSSRWVRTREWLLDGNGNLWYCSDEFDERNFTDLTNSLKNKDVKKLNELQQLMDAYIPPLTKANHY